MILLFLLLFRRLLCIPNQGQEFSSNLIKYANTGAHTYTVLLKITETSFWINRMRKVTLYCHIAINITIHFPTDQYKHAWDSRGEKPSKSLALCLDSIV